MLNLQLMLINEKRIKHGKKRQAKILIVQPEQMSGVNYLVIK